MDLRKFYFVFILFVGIFFIFVFLPTSNVLDVKHFIKVGNKTVTNGKHEFTMKISYLLENANLCVSGYNLSVVIIVHTAPSHHERRQTIRETWANNSYYTHLGSVRVLFLLGAVMNTKLQIEIEEEFKQNGDILQGDFIDHYHNLTYKGVMAYKWLSENCKNVKIVLKVDDDVVVNMFKFFTGPTYLQTFLKKTHFMTCRRFHKNKIMRNPKNKWYVNATFFTNQTRYPDYCQGFVVIFTNDLTEKLYQSALETPFFWVDDVYLYGMVPGKIKGIQYKHLRYGKEVVFGDVQTIKCNQEQRHKCPYLVSMFRSNAISAMKESWRLMVQNYRDLSIQHRDNSTMNGSSI